MRRDRRAVLDDAVVEERDAHFERVRHRHPVEVVEHVVGECELRVDDRASPAADGPGPQSAIAAPRGGSAVVLGKRAAIEGTPRSRVDASAHREQALGRIVRPRACAPARSNRAARAAPNGRRPAQRRRQPPARRRRAPRPVLPVAAEQLVRPLPRERHRHVLRRQLRDRVEAERREVGHRLVEMPDEILEIDSRVGDGELELVMLGPERRGDEAGIVELVAHRVLREPDRECLHRL